MLTVDQILTEQLKKQNPKSKQPSIPTNYSRWDPATTNAAAKESPKLGTLSRPVFYEVSELHAETHQVARNHAQVA